MIDDLDVLLVVIRPQGGLVYGATILSACWIVVGTVVMLGVGS